MEVHRGAKDTKEEKRLFVMLGKVNFRWGTIGWSKSDHYDDGETLAVALNDDGVVVEVHQAGRPPRRDAGTVSAVLHTGAGPNDRGGAAAMSEIERIDAGEIELISDGDGLAVIGDPTAVERFMASTGLSKLDSHDLGAALRAGSSATQMGSEIAQGSGRWMKLTAESAQNLKRYGLTPTETQGVSHAMLGQRGSIKKWLQIETGPGAMVTNPALLSGVAGIMAQQAMQQSMAEIADYLARIDEKLDDVLRAQTNQVLARMDGVDLAIKEAMSVRASVGRVSEVTWSKVQNSAQTIHESQGYALRQLADLADKLDRKSKVGELAKIARDAEAEVEKWLTVLARCFQLHDAVAVLELDRVLDASPDELDRHRLGLKAARQDRLELMSASTEILLTHMLEAARTANSKVLFNPTQSPAVIKSGNHVAIEIRDFHEMLGIEAGSESSEARRWSEAAAESWDKTRATSAQGVDTVKQFGSETGARAKSVKNKLSGRIAERKRRQPRDGVERDEQG